MANLGRQTLYSIFVNGAIPTEKDYQALINSMLNRRDDCFFGKWRPGVTYCEGDVVLYKKSLYQLVLPVEEGCEPVSGEANGGDAGQVPRGCICSDIPPDEDTERWCLLELKIQDEDWDLIIDSESGRVTGVARVAGRVAIGTMNPKARLDVTDELSGRILVEPDQDGNPAITLVRLSEPPGEFDPPLETARVDYRLESERVCWDTDTLGYVFKVMGEEVGSFARARALKQDTPAQKGPPKPAPKPTEPPVLMLITHTPEGRASVGIGTDLPQANLDAIDQDKGRLLVNPHFHPNAEVILANLAPAGNNDFFLAEVGQSRTVLSTSASNGFLFTRSQDDFYDLMKNEHGPGGKPLLSITGEGNVGIGTADPAAILEVTDGESGQFKMSVKKPNPAFAIVNLRPHSQGNYLTAGVDNDQGIIMTDADDGLAICKSERYDPEELYEEDIHQQSETLVRIHPKCKEGDPQKVDKLKLIPTLEVNGIERTYGSYIRAGKNEYAQTGELEDVLAKVCSLDAIKFRWDENKTRCGDIGEQIGLAAHQVEEYFPQVVMKGTDGQKAIAYQNLVPVLIEAIKDLAGQIEVLNQRISGLEEQQSAAS